MINIDNTNDYSSIHSLVMALIHVSFMSTFRELAAAVWLALNSSNRWDFSGRAWKTAFSKDAL